MENQLNAPAESLATEEPQPVSASPRNMRSSASKKRQTTEEPQETTMDASQATVEPQETMTGAPQAAVEPQETTAAVPHTVDEPEETDTAFVIADLYELGAYVLSIAVIVIVVIGIILFFRDYSVFDREHPVNRSKNYTTRMFISATQGERPCHDFYQYVCGSWIRNHSYGPSTIAEELQAMVYKEAALQLESRLVSASLLSKSAVAKANVLFKSCYSMVIDRQEDRIGLADFLKPRTSFPDIRPMSTEDMVDLLIELSLSYNIHILFRTTIFADQEHDGLPTLLLTENDQLVEWLKIKVNISASNGKVKQYMTAILGSLDAFNERDADDLLETIVQRDNKVIPIVVRHFLEDYGVFSGTFKDMPQIIPDIEADVWVAAVNKQTRPYFTVDLDSTVKVEGTGVFKNIGKLLTAVNGNDTKLLPTVIAWHLVRQLAHRASYRTMSVLFQSFDILYDYCFEETLHLMPLAAGTPFALKSPTSRTRSVAADIVEDIRGSMGDFLQRATWLDDESRRKALLKLNNIQEVLVQPDVAFNETALDIYYENFTVHKTYFETWLHATRAAAQRKMASLVVKPRFYTHEFNPLMEKAFYIHHFNTIFLPSGILRDPYVDEVSPPGMNFGGLGHLLGHEIMHAFDDIGKEWDEDGHINTWWTHFVEDEYFKRVDCLERVYQFESSSPTAQVIADFASLPVVYAAFSNKTSQSVHHHLEYERNFTERQIFFMNYCFKKCSRIAEVKDGYSTVRERCNSLLRNFRPFADAFGCKAQEAMNAGKRCEFWLIP
ncbi:membrane metallo-endopeptidase-like 1 [Ornithodoros turicata]|uniref:membrane metallo-endopeptidase-like 1 n=1 Tax=Ornithodoros turicata TaxID=34597 RepID=UPI003139732C